MRNACHTSLGLIDRAGLFRRSKGGRMHSKRGNRTSRDTIRHGKDGTVFPVSLAASQIRDESDESTGSAAVLNAVTAQKQAFEAAQRMAAIVESSDDAIIGMTLAGIVTSWNPAAERMLGSSEEIIGKLIHLLSPSDRSHEMKAILAKITAGQHVDHLETIRQRKDGTPITVSISVSPIHDVDRAIVGASTIARDVTEQKQAAENARSLTAAEDLVRSVLASASIGIALADLDGSFRVVNQSLCDLLGYLSLIHI